MIKVAVCGAMGKMGKEVCQAVLDCPDTELVAKIDIASDEMYHHIEDANRVVDIDVLVDFTQPKSIFENAKYCLNNGIKIVIGTTGLKDEEIEFLKKLSQEKNTGCLIAPNFSTGAVLMMMFARQAAKYFDNAEIIELHHNQKKDAPSGTAIKTAAMMAEVKDDFTKNNCPETETIEGARGGNSYSNIHIHSVRMPWLHRITRSNFRFIRSNYDNPSRFNGQKMLYARSIACSKTRRREKRLYLWT